MLNYVIRGFKWDYYLGNLGISIGRAASFSVFFAGFVMAITPGKMGEVLKSLLLYERFGVAVTRTAPAVFAERLTDVVALVVISFGAAAFFAAGGAGGAFEPSHAVSLAAAAGLTAAAIAAISSDRFMNAALGAAEKVSFLKKFAVHIEELFAAARTLFTARALAWASFLSIVAWGLECLSLYYIVTTLAPDRAAAGTAAACFFSYAFSTILGAFAMVPGGLFVTEGGMSFLLVKLAGLALAQAVAATFIVRLATLWFALAVGIVSLPAFDAITATASAGPAARESGGRPGPSGGANTDGR